MLSHDSNKGEHEGACMASQRSSFKLKIEKKTFNVFFYLTYWGHFLTKFPFVNSQDLPFICILHPRILKYKVSCMTGVFL